MLRLPPARPEPSYALALVVPPESFRVRYAIDALSLIARASERLLVYKVLGFGRTRSVNGARITALAQDSRLSAYIRLGENTKRHPLLS